MFIKNYLQSLKKERNNFFDVYKQLFKDNLFDVYKQLLFTKFRETNNLFNV